MDEEDQGLEVEDENLDQDMVPEWHVEFKFF